VTHDARRIERGAELLSETHEATHLHYIPENGTLWLDTDSGVEDGLCIGIGETRHAALLDARAELHARVADLDRALATEVAS
jgi:hypothetical protein